MLVSGPAWIDSARAAEISDLSYFLNNFKGPADAKFNMRCYQRGVEIVVLKGLRIRKVVGKLTVGHHFVDRAGNVVGLFLSNDTSCIVKQWDIR